VAVASAGQYASLPFFTGRMPFLLPN